MMNEIGILDVLLPYHTSQWESYRDRAYEDVIMRRAFHQHSFHEGGDPLQK